MKEYYSVGEFSRLFGINVQTLHYYDHIGLFSPARRNPETGRRLYAFDQVYKLASIRFMRRLGYDIDQIKMFLKTSDVDQALEGLRERSRQMRAQWQDLLFIDNVIQRKLLFIEQKVRTIDVDSVTIRWFPQRSYIPIGGEESLYFHDSFYFYPTVVFYHGTEKMFGAYLDTSFSGIELEAQKAEPIETETIPAGRFICAFHQGPYAGIKDTYRRACAVFPELAHEDEHISFNIIDQFVENDSANYITEIQIPIKEPSTER